MIRSDLSECLVHLTRGATADEAVGKFTSIMNSKTLLGGDGHIRGGYKCVCFSEAPISAIAQILAQPSVHDMRYAPFGVMVRKPWLFGEGGRPVIYQPEIEFDLLPETLRYRHVRYEPGKDVDHTWEREWRLKADALELNLAEVTFVVPSRAWEDKFMESHAGNLRGLAMFVGSDPELVIHKNPRHFVVLEDLGVYVDWPPVGS